MVYALPMVAYLVLTTLVFPNYLEAWNAEELWSAGLVVFPFWSIVASYRGVVTRFKVDRFRRSSCSGCSRGPYS